MRTYINNLRRQVLASEIPLAYKRAMLANLESARLKILIVQEQLLFHGNRRGGWKSKSP